MVLLKKPAIHTGRLAVSCTGASHHQRRQRIAHYVDNRGPYGGEPEIQVRNPHAIGGVRRVLTVARPERIILFGSAATGQMTKDSDLDLLVVESDPADTRDRSVRIRRALGDVRYPVDVIVMSGARFQETMNLIGGIAYPAWKYGRVLYEAA
jgi:predicted nucleotidyltransferase